MAGFGFRHNVETVDVVNAAMDLKNARRGDGADAT